VPASPPASPTPELPLDPEPLPDPELPLDPEDPEPPLNPKLSLAASLEPERVVDPDPLPLPEPKPLPLDDDVTSFTPASPFPLFEPGVPQPAERPTKAASVVTVANLAPNHGLMTLS
jgi:hypothetical protein